MSDVAMKAYSVTDREYYLPYAIIVFAESRGKAISYALGQDGFEGLDFTEINAIRAKWADKYYRGKHEMDWDNPGDRLAMVVDGGFRCGDEVFDPDDCERCCAKEECEKYSDYRENDMEDF